MNSAIHNTIHQYLDKFMETIAEKYDIQREELDDLWKETQKTKPAKKNKKNNKRKKSSVPSAYILFSQEERPKIKQEHPDMGFVEVGRELGKRWKKASENVKAYFQDKHDLLVQEKTEEQPSSPAPSIHEEEEEVVVQQTVVETTTTSATEPVVAAPVEKEKKPKKTKAVQIPEEITDERERELWVEFAQLTKAELQTKCDHNNLKKSNKRNDMIQALVTHRIALEDGNTQLDSSDEENDGSDEEEY